MVAVDQQQLSAPSEPGAEPYYDSLYFAGTLSEADFEKYPALAAIAPADSRITTVDVTFPWSPVTDIRFETAGETKDYRTIHKTYEECGCKAASSGIFPVVIIAGGVFGCTVWVRRARRRN